MPQAHIRDPFTSPAMPAWLRSLRDWVAAPQPEGFFSTPVERPGRELGKETLRQLLGLTGITDPASQVLGVMGAGARVPRPPLPPRMLREALQSGGPLSRSDLEGLLHGLSPEEATRYTKNLPIATPIDDPLKATFDRLIIPGRSGRLSETRRFTPPAAERVGQVYDIGISLPRQADWGDVLDPEMLHGFADEPETAKIYGDVWSGLSNQNPVPNNTAESISVWLHKMLNPDVTFTPEILRNLPYQKVNLTTSKYGNVNRAFWGEPLSGPKVLPMSRYMHGAGTGREVMTPDTHALYGSGVTRPSPSMTQELPNLRRLARREQGMREGTLSEEDLVGLFQDALYNTLRPLGPGQRADRLFGTFYEGVRAQKGQPFQGSVKDILRDRRLLEYGAMLDPRALARALQRGGSWRAGSILPAGLLPLVASHGDDDDSQVGLPPPEVPPPSEEPY